MNNRLSVVVSLVAAAGVSLTGSGEPRVRLESPLEAALLTGPTMLRAEIDPPSAARSAVFSVDGREVCVRSRPPFECEWDAGPAIAPHHVRLVVNLAAGDRIVQTVRTSGIAFAETVDVNVVQVTVTVMDDDGKYVKGLPRSAFHLAEDGRAQAVSHFYSDEAPLELVVAVDTSGSMQEAMAKMKQAVAGFLAAVPARHSVTLLGFNDAAFALAPKTADAAARMRAVDQLSAWGLTALYDTIIRGVDTLGAQPGRKALLVFTDGDDRGSHVTVDEAERWLQSSDLVLYMIGQGQGVTHDPLKKLMTRLARPTGGRAISTHSIDALRESFTEVLDELSNQYVLGYEPTNAIRDGAWREINVTVDGHQRVRARLGYRAASRK